MDLGLVHCKPTAPAPRQLLEHHPPDGDCLVALYSPLATLPRAASSTPPRAPPSRHRAHLRRVASVSASVRVRATSARVSASIALSCCRRPVKMSRASIAFSPVQSRTPVAVARDQLGLCELGTREPQHPIAPRALDVSRGPALKAHRELPLAHPACGQLGPCEKYGGKNGRVM